PSRSSGRSMGSAAFEQTFHNHDVLPDAVQFPVVLVDAHLTKAAGTKQPQTGGVFRKDTREQLPEPRVLGRDHERLQGESAGPAAARRASRMDRKLGDPRVTISVGTVIKGGGECK